MQYTHCVGIATYKKFYGMQVSRKCMLPFVTYLNKILRITTLSESLQFYYFIMQLTLRIITIFDLFKYVCIWKL